MKEKGVESKLGGADYSACVRCKYSSQYGTHGPYDYCMKDDSGFREKHGYPKSVENEVFYLGCGKFEWNGMPIHPAAYKQIMENEEFRDSVLRNLPEKAIFELTFWECARENGWGAYFDKEKFEKTVLKEEDKK